MVYHTEPAKRNGLSLRAGKIQHVTDYYLQLSASSLHSACSDKTVSSLINTIISWPRLPKAPATPLNQGLNRIYTFSGITSVLITALILDWNVQDGGLVLSACCFDSLHRGSLRVRGGDSKRNKNRQIKKNKMNAWIWFTLQPVLPLSSTAKWVNKSPFTAYREC